jgi:hypothetical protein
VTKAASERVAVAATPGRHPARPSAIRQRRDCGVQGQRGQHNAKDRFPGDQARGDQCAAFLSFRPQAARLGQAVANPPNEATDKDGSHGLEGEVHSHGHEHGRGHARQNEDGAERRARPQQPPRHFAAHDALRQLSHQPRLRRRQVHASDPAGGLAGPIENDNGRHQEEGKQNHRHNLDQLHFPGRAAQQVTGFQILRQRSRHAAGAANHRRHAEHSSNALRPFDAHGEHHECGQHQSRQRQAGNWLVRAAHQAYQVSPHG